MPSKLTRSEKVFQAVVAATRNFNPKEIDSSLDALYIQSLAKITGVSSNNISMELNRLYLDGRLLRVRGRPILYLSVSDLEFVTGKELPAREFPSLQAFTDFLNPRKAKDKAEEPFSSRNLLADASSDFDSLIGATQSLRVHIEQAKAAILYPPYGLHTLITGQTGVGKSHFVNAMFDFAKKSRRLSQSSSMVTFNCANYSENPQLLMSQLFGSSKGAFTGADADRPGLVELADKSMLFLDEIHRLSPEGQEKLFLLMDKGTFRRLGETTKTRHADVLLVGATTESPQSSMLSTFLRRIPVHIELPSLSERSIRERVQLVFFFFWKESGKLKKKISIDREVISTFVHYDCPTNIGQLSTDIQLTCANAYYQYLLHSQDTLKIEFGSLSRDIALSLFTSGGSSKIMDSLLKKGKIEIDGSASLDQLFEAFLY